MKKTEHTLMITGSLPPIRCGIGFYTDKLLSSFGDSSHTSVLTTTGAMPSSRVSALYGTDNWKVRNVFRIVKTVKTDMPSIIHIQYPAVGYKRELGINLLPLLLRLLYRRAPIVITLHEYHSSALLGRIRSAITALFCKRIVVSNESDRQALPLLLRRKATIIPIGSNITKVGKNSKTLRAQLLKHKLDSSLPTVVYFGFTNEAKGVHVLASASAKMNANVLLITELSKDDTYQAKVLANISEAQSQGAQIAVSGYLDDVTVSEILQEANVFVLPQPLPITAKSGTTIAAVQHGLIIVSSANRDTNLNLPYISKYNSLLLPKMDAENLASAISLVLTDHELATTIRKNLPELTTYFSWEDIAKKHAALYESI